MAQDLKDNKATGNDGSHDDEVFWSEEDEFKEIANEWNEESAGHDTDDTNKEAATKEVERARNPIDENKIDGEGDEHRDGGKLWAREALQMRNKWEGGHTERNCKANWERIGQNISDKVIFDTISIVF